MAAAGKPESCVFGVGKRTGCAFQLDVNTRTLLEVSRISQGTRRISRLCCLLHSLMCCVIRGEGRTESTPQIGKEIARNPGYPRPILKKSKGGAVPLRLLPVL